MNIGQRSSIAAVVIFVLSATYLTVKIFDIRDLIDFKTVWLAGEIWRQGHSAYGPEYLAEGKRIFWESNVPFWFPYPPNWYPVARPLGNFSFDEASIYWRAISAVLLISGFWFAATSASKANPNIDILQYALFFMFVAVGSATAISLSTGQTSILIFFGTAVFLWGYVQNRRVAVALALAVLVMKPNFGLPFVAFCLFQREYWPAVIAAGVIALAMAAPALVPYGPVNVIGDYAAVLGQFHQVQTNTPETTTGLRNLFFHATGIDLKSYFPMALACLTAAAIGAVPRNDTRTRLAKCLFLIAASLFFVPMHTYDFIIIAPLVLLDRRLSRYSTWIAVAGLLVIFRMNNFAYWTGITMHSERFLGGSLVTSLAITAIAIGMALYLRQAAFDGGESKQASLAA